jgi:hypothetical protein
MNARAEKKRTLVQKQVFDKFESIKGNVTLCLREATLIKKCRFTIACQGKNIS